MNYIKSITTKQLWVFIAGALLFKIVLLYLLEDVVTDVFIALFKVLPSFAQDILFSATLGDLQLTETERSVLFGVGTFENLIVLIEILYILAFLWIIAKGIRKIFAK